MKQSASLMWNAPTCLEVPTLIVEEWHYTLGKNQARFNSQCMRTCFSERKGGAIYKPHNPQLSLEIAPGM